ncbi:MAG: cupin domain-containing protein [Bacteroidales bacterium]|nr:MAG: cupin domain-containing protein [Bacteroidales bacterium]
MKPIFPGMITNLPEADIPFDGVKGWISQSDDHQVVFLEIEPIGAVPEHAHGAQWGIIVEGEMVLTIGGNTKKYKKGDTYFIPDGVNHSAVFNTRTWAVDYFADRDRYKRRIV